MKVALIVHDASELAGQGRYVLALAEHLASRHDVTVFANSMDRAANARWQGHHVRAWRRAALTTVLTYPLGLEAAASALREFDIRHAQGFCGRRANVVTAHICVAAYVASLASPTSTTGWSLGVMAALEARFYRRYRGPVIAVSAKVGRELREWYSVSGPIHVLPHGVDVSRFAVATRGREREATRAAHGLRSEEIVALYVGDLTKAHVHLRALAGAARDVRLLVVTASRRYRWSAPNVTFVPPVRDVERYYAAADALVFPSTYDAFGMVVLEAMACGLPVFVSDATGASALVDGTNGVAVALSGWVEATVTALRDRPRLQALGTAAAATARRHSWSTIATAVEEIYASVGRMA